MYIIYHIIIIIINKCFNIVIIYNNVLINNHVDNPYSLRQKRCVFTELTGLYLFIY